MTEHNRNLLLSSLRIDGLTGVGTVSLSFDSGQRLTVWIGTNGIGKTKALEAVFQFLLLSHRTMAEAYGQNIIISKDSFFVCHSIQHEDRSITLPINNISWLNWQQQSNISLHELPIVFMGSQNRGYITGNTPSSGGGAILTLSQRRKHYLDTLFNGMKNGFSGLNMQGNVEGWFVARAQSANPYQKKEDNREIELTTLLKLLHEVDDRIDAKFLEIGGDGRVSIEISDQKRELSQLSSGFASLIKLLQTIIAGYGYFTNESNLQTVKGVVLIDEIESHLHLAWQAKILPLLLRLFPNTHFIVTSHSPLILAQLSKGVAFRLERSRDGVVECIPLHNPDKAALVDVLRDAFNVDLNRLKLERMSADDQQVAKKHLLELIS